MVDCEPTNKPGIAIQIHGIAVQDNINVKLSIVEDLFAGMFDIVEKQFGNTVVNTESIDGLYHRKLRTISGCATGQSEIVTGGRQTARDLFDIAVLHHEYQPVGNFIQYINSSGANFPYNAYMNGLRAMPWCDLIDEFNNIEAIGKHKVDMRKIDPMNIYQLSIAVNRDYKRVYTAVKRLERLGVLVVCPCMHNKRKTSLVGAVGANDFDAYLLSR